MHRPALLGQSARNDQRSGLIRRFPLRAAEALQNRCFRPARTRGYRDRRAPRFPEAFTRLVTCGETADRIGQSSATNPYLFRETERRLAGEKMPLSAIKDMIGSQSTKAMHVVARFAPTPETCGVWTDRDRRLTIIETYPGLCCARLQDPHPKKEGRDADVRDARVCAKVALDFTLCRERLEGPPARSPESEGWIWAQRRNSG